MRHVGQKFALGLIGRLGCRRGFLQLLGALLDAPFQQLLLLANFLARIRQRLDHAVQALAQKLDFVARPADLDRLQAAVPNCEMMPACSSLQRARQETNGEPRDGPGDQHHHHEQQQPFAGVEVVLPQVVGEKSGHYPEQSAAVKIENLDARERNTSRTRTARPFFDPSGIPVHRLNIHRA